MEQLCGRQITTQAELERQGMNLNSALFAGSHGKNIQNTTRGGLEPEI